MKKVLTVLGCVWLALFCAGMSVLLIALCVIGVFFYSTGNAVNRAINEVENSPQNKADRFANPGHVMEQKLKEFKPFDGLQEPPSQPPSRRTIGPAF